MNPDNPVVQLCLAGMQAEGEGNHEQARTLFTQAWETASDEYEACVAAHYVVRQQESPEEMLRWNQESLRLAEAVGDERVRDFFPSLLLNLGYSYEVLGNADEARRYYELAAQRAELLPADRYGKIVRDGIARGQQRVALNQPQETSSSHNNQQQP
jgi:tetratricopeptide (TPR) repeat protein